MIRRSQEDVIHRLACASSYRDEETEMHIRSTGLLCELLAKAAGWSAEEAENLRMAAPMHDVGKIAISDAILRKPGELTAEEFEVMKTHTTIGAKMLAGSDSPVLQMAAEIALNHHERWDGGGYPQGTAGHAIPESARIMAIVDVYDDLSHDRAQSPGIAGGRSSRAHATRGGHAFRSAACWHCFSAIPPKCAALPNSTRTNRARQS